MAPEGTPSDKRTTDSGIEIRPVYTAADLEGWDPATRLGEPIEEWQLEVPIFARRVTLSFVGCAVRFNHLVMIGSDASAGLIRACEEPLDHGADEIPAFAVQQFLAALRSESSSPKRDRETRLYRELEDRART